MCGQFCYPATPKIGHGEKLNLKSRDQFKTKFLILTHKMLKRMLFITTKQNVQILGRIPSFQTTKQHLNSEK